MVRFLHVTKTAGTALKNSLKDSPGANCSIFTKHSKVLKDHSDVGFIVRDPWQRFASGFWERRTLDLIREVRQNRSKLPQRYATGGMGINYTPFEEKLFKHASTPNELITHLKQNNNDRLKFNDFKMDTAQNNFGQLCASYTFWLGTLQEYKNNEHRVKIAIDIDSLSSVMKIDFGVLMNHNPYIARTRAQFDISQSYEISEENLEWFKKWRNEDYKLLEYIKTRPYYRSIK